MGRLEAVVDGRAIGWAWDPERPDEAVEVEVVVDGRAVASAVADVERPMLAEAGIGDGRHGFYLPLPEELSDRGEHTVRVTIGPDCVDALPIEAFETVVRVPDGPWSHTKFVPGGVHGRREPFVPEDEAPDDPGEAALLGEDGWLFLRDDANLNPEQLAGGPLLRPEAIGRGAEMIAERHRTLRELRIPYLFAAAPMKERLYAKFLPEQLALHPALPVRQLNAALRATNGGEILDLMPALVEGRRRGDVFPRTDSCWSDRGAFFAYRDLMKEAGKRVIDLGDPLLYEEVSFSPRQGFRGDLADKPKVALATGALTETDDEGDWAEEIEVADVSTLRSMRMPAPEHLEVTPGRAPHLYETPNAADLPRAVLVGDASCLRLIQWLAEHFSRFVFLWTDTLPLEAIELEMPDVLIHVVSERRLVNGP